LSEPIVQQPPEPAKDARVVRRRQIIRWGLIGAGAAAAVGVAGYEVIQSSTPTIRLGIAPGSQTLWRYVAQRKDDLLGSLGYNVSFAAYPDEATLRKAFVDGQLEIIASLVPTVGSLSLDGIKAQLFLPIAWLHEGYPFVVPGDSSIVGLKNLPGRRIATYPLTHPGMAYWEALLLAGAQVNLAGLHPSETLSPDLALLQKTVDAACMGGAQWASLGSRGGYRKLADLQTAWSAVSGSKRVLLYGGYIARADFLQQQAKFVADFTRVNLQAFQAYKSGPSPFLQVTAAYQDNAAPQMTVGDNQNQATYLGYDDVDSTRMTISQEDIADYGRLFGLMTDAGYFRAPISDVSSLFYRSAVT
jgi:ABC-type nitrate/sulfonate/bicarbonate transport system substrate-binding protein